MTFLLSLLLSRCRCSNEFVTSKIAHSFTRSRFPSARFLALYCLRTWSSTFLGRLLENQPHVIFTWKGKLSTRTPCTPYSRDMDSSPTQRTSVEGIQKVWTPLSVFCLRLNIYFPCFFTCYVPRRPNSEGYTNRHLCSLISYNFDQWKLNFTEIMTVSPNKSIPSLEFLNLWTQGLLEGKDTKSCELVKKRMSTSTSTSWFLGISRLVLE